MSNLSNKIASYSPEQFIRFNTAYSSSPTNIGSGGTGAWILSNETPVLNATGGPDQEGSWQFNYGGNNDTSTTRLRISTSASHLTTDPEIQDGIFSAGVWFKFPTIPTTAVSMTSSISLLRFGIRGNTTTFSMILTNDANKGKITFSRIGGSTSTTSNRYDDGNWHYLAIRIDNSSTTLVALQEFYIDGVLVGSATNTTVTAGTLKQIELGTSVQTSTSDILPPYELSNFYIGDFNTIDSTAISEIYTAGAQAPSTNITITDTPAIVTALQTEPTIVIVNYDNVEVVTSITADALMLEPTYSAVTNISNQVTALTASAETFDHTIISGTGVLDNAEPFLASAQLVMPASFGSGEVNVETTSLTASGMFNDPTLNITPNYYNLVRSHTPSLFVIDPASDGTFINKGFDNWGTSNKAAAVVAITSPGQFLGIGNALSITQLLESSTSVSFGFNDSNADSQSYYFESTGSNSNNFTLETWVYIRPNGIRTSLDEVISIGGTKLKISSSQIRFEMNSDEIPNDGILEPFIHTQNTTIASGSWHHFVVTGQYGGDSLNLTTQIYHNGQILGSRNWFHTIATPASTGITFNGNSGGLFAYYNGLALYKRVLTNSEIISHYDFIATSSPNRLIVADPIEVGAAFVLPSFVASANKNFPATPITGSSDLVDPITSVSVGDEYFAELMEASATFVNPFFYGNPDTTIDATAMTATADIPPNIYRLDTAYYSYVQTNIAPKRYVTFDSPNNNADWGSDNDFGSAAPFTYGGSITAAINGLNNNSLLSNGLDYTTSGLIMKESEHDDAWGTDVKTWHTSFWIKKDESDTNPNGLRIIANLNSFENNKHIILYQYNNYLYLQMDDKVNTPETYQSSVNVNVFDYVKHHIVISVTSNNKIHVYKNKALVIDQDFGSINVVTTNSASYWAPNTETNNKPRFAIGALITPYAETNLPVTPTASKLLIDEAHWALTSINQTGVNNLYAAMPFKVEIEWNADVFLSNNSYLPEPTFGTGTTSISNIFDASAELPNPALTVDFEKIINATAITASAEAIEPFSVIGDSISHVNVYSDIFLASANIGEHIVTMLIRAQAMLASVIAVNSKPSYDEYNTMIIQQSRIPLGSNFYGRWLVGDVD